jgi:hypothetical protein
VVFTKWRGNLIVLAYWFSLSMQSLLLLCGFYNEIQTWKHSNRSVYSFMLSPVLEIMRYFFKQKQVRMVFNLHLDILFCQFKTWLACILGWKFNHVLICVFLYVCYWKLQRRKLPLMKMSMFRIYSPGFF